MLTRCAVKISLMIAFAITILPQCAVAQYSGTIQGTLTDSSGALLTSAQVTLTGEDTGVSQTTTPTGAGFYQFTSLRPGSYAVSAASPGFAGARQQHIVLQTYETKLVNLSLGGASVNQKVVVNADSQQVQLDDPKQTYELSGKALEDMPLEGRSTYAAIAQAPGVVSNPTVLGDGGNSSAVLGFNTASYPFATVRDMPTYTTQFYLDGSNVTVLSQGGGGSTITPNVESVQSVRVSANDFSAEYNPAGGLLTQITTKGGTDKIHGSAYYFYSGAGLTARNTFQYTPDPVTGKYIPPYNMNQFGGSIGGPIRKGKTFYFGSFGYYTGGLGTSAIVPVETPELLAFMQKNYPNNISTHLLTTYPVNVSGVTAGTEQTVASYTTNCLGTGPLGLPCSTPIIGTAPWSATQATNGYQFNGRIDQVFNEKNTLFGEFYRTGNLFQVATPRTAFGWTSNTNSSDAIATWTHVFDARASNQAAFAYTRLYTNFPNCSVCSVPYIEGVTGVNAPGDPGYGSGIDFNYQGRDSVTITRGKHSLAFGGHFVYSESSQDQNKSLQRPDFTFLTPFTFLSDSPYQETYNVNPSTGQVTDFSRAFHTVLYGAYVQDEWKVTPHLTFNAGLRWDYQGRVGEEQGRLSNIVLGTGSTVLQQIATASVAVQPHTPTDTFKSAFGPRFAFAWDPIGNGRTSIRGGFGLFFFPVPWGALTGGSQNVPFTAGVTATTLIPSGPQPLYALGTSNNAPYGFSFPNVTLGVNSHGGLNGGGTSVSAVDPSLKDGYAENFFFGIQQQLGANWILEVNYLGTNGKQLFMSYDRNRYDGDTASGTLVRPNPYFSTITYLDNSGYSNFNAGVVSLKRQLTKVFFVSGNYMYAHALDNENVYGPAAIPGTVYDVQNVNLQYGSANSDVRHFASVQGLWQLPALANQQWLVKNVLGGWQLTGTATLHSGYPFTVYTSGADYNQDGTYNDLPMAPPVGTKRSLSNHDLRYGGGILATEFAAPPAGQEGNVGRNTFRMAGFEQVDMSLAKNFGLNWFAGDKANLQIRAEATNAFNHVNFNELSMNSDISNPATFGTNSGVWTPRFFQLAARLSF